MTETYYCPLDGCDYGESNDKSKAAVQAHINARGDDEHDWDTLKPDLYAQHDESDDESDEDTDEGNDTADEGNGSESDTGTKDDDAEEGDDMAARDDYNNQGSEEIDVEAVDNASDGIGFLPRLDGLTMVLLMAVAAALVIILIKRGDDDGGQHVEMSEGGDDDDDESGSSPATDEEVTLIG